jgi:hypothetical protein
MSYLAASIADACAYTMFRMAGDADAAIPLIGAAARGGWGGGARGGRGRDSAALPPPLESSLVGGASSQNKDKSIFRYCLELRSLRISDSGFRSISKEQYRNYNCPYFFVHFNFSTK